MPVTHTDTDTDTDTNAVTSTNQSNPWSVSRAVVKHLYSTVHETNGSGRFSPEHGQEGGPRETAWCSALTNKHIVNHIVTICFTPVCLFISPGLDGFHDMYRAPRCPTKSCTICFTISKNGTMFHDMFVH